jgi:hypothetical protein
MKKSYLLWSVVALAVALATLTGCGSSNESDSASKGESSTPSAPTATPLSPTVTPVPDNVTADQLRLLILAAAGTVKDVKWDRPSGGTTITFTETESLRLTTYFPGSPPLNPTDKVDTLDTVEGKRYWRVNDGPWKYDPDAPLIPLHAVERFPYWATELELPVGGQHTSPQFGGTGTSSVTVTDLSVSPAPSRGANRCWALMVTAAIRFVIPGSPDEESEQQHILTACEPDFLVTARTIHWISPPGSDDSVSDNYRYNTGEVLEVPTRAVEVHCEQYPQGSQEKGTCMFQ